MNIGVLKEIKTEENRVAMIPAGAEIMVHNGTGFSLMIIHRYGRTIHKN